MFLQSCLQSPFGLPDADLAAAAGDTIYHIGLFTKRDQMETGETKRRLETKLKEHRDAYEREMMDKLAVVEHACQSTGGRPQC